MGHVSAKDILLELEAMNDEVEAICKDCGEPIYDDYERCQPCDRAHRVLEAEYRHDSITNR